MGCIAVSGADGFIGRHLCELLEAEGNSVIRLVRRSLGPAGIRRIADLTSTTDLASLLGDATTIVHLAGRAHVLSETARDPSAEFERTNVVGTLRLAEAASAAGLRRFVFVSSIGVNGNATYDKPFTETDEPAPVDLYAQSKLRAENKLREFCKRRSMELVIVRPTLVYGAGAPGNFQRLVRLAGTGLPLPLGAVRNRRSLISVGNLAEFLSLCAMHPAAAGHTFLIAEPEVHSTPQLISALAAAMGRSTSLFNAPLGLLRFCADVVGKGSEFDKLCSSLEVSALKAERTLGWKPQRSFADEIAKSVAGLRNR